MKITENKLKEIVAESVKTVLNEWTDSSRVENMWNLLLRVLGPQKMLAAIYHQVSEEHINEIVRVLEITFKDELSKFMGPQNN